MPSADLGRSDRGARSAPTRAVQPAIIRMPQAKDPKPTDGGGAANKDATHLISGIAPNRRLSVLSQATSSFPFNTEKRRPTFRLFQARFSRNPELMH